MSVQHTVTCDWCGAIAPLEPDRGFPSGWKRTSHLESFDWLEEEDLCPSCLGHRKAIISDALVTGRRKAKERASCAEDVAAGIIKIPAGCCFDARNLDARCDKGTRGCTVTHYKKKEPPPP